MKRLLATVMMGSACIFACAQTPAFQTVQDSFVNLRSNDSLLLRMNARNEIGKKVYTYNIDLSWLRGVTKTGDVVYQLESVSSDASGMIRRIVGDSRTFWVYEAPSNTYWTEIYWKEGSSQPATYQSQLMQAFSRATRGSESFLARMIQEVYAGAQAAYRPWVIADSGNSRLVGPSSRTSDPMNPNDPNADFVTGPNQEIALFWAAAQNQLAHRCVVFFLDIDNNNVRHLKAIEHRDIQSQSPFRFNSFRIDVTESPNIPAGTFNFVPPQNARAIVNTRPGIG
ncbi:MAG: hypothetical protein KF784_01930 [Fimbriimonadaceae bacterium]|nr:hypothetical protein [Fimbriimonadaceae bacterium]